jgi:hypothetical protein
VKCSPMLQGRMARSLTTIERSVQCSCPCRAGTAFAPSATARAPRGMALQAGGCGGSCSDLTRIKNWSKFQHFKDRRPPWVKLYRDLLDDMEWHQLEPRAAKALVMLWLIASENDGELPEAKTLAFRLRTTERSEVLDVLSELSHWLEQDDDA